jgi:hypothetical protein
MVYVKIEPQDDEGPLPPWAAPEHKGPPWVEPKPEPEQAKIKVEGEGVTIIKESTPEPEAPKTDAKPDKKEAAAVKAMLARPYQPLPEGGQSSARNYLAVEAHGGFGLIDRGTASGGLHDLLAHAPRRGDPWFARLRVGETFQAVARGGGPAQPLKVRYLTPARYYAPGRRVTTLGVGVDERAWQRLVVSTRP